MIAGSKRNPKFGTFELQRTTRASWIASIGRAGQSLREYESVRKQTAFVPS